ncbi:MAG: S-layer protein [Candidatus Woesearchaeota archaeon]
MNRLVKKIVALGAGTFMLGATVMGALAAANLNQYPAPFIQNGKFNGLIVVGSTAKADDVIGATDIGMSLQAANVIEKPIEGTTQTVVEGGVKIETSSNRLNYDEALTSTGKTVITETDLPELLKTTTLTDRSGNSYNVKTQVGVIGAKVNFGKSLPETDEPVLYLDVSTGTPSYTLQIQFPTAVNLTNAYGKTITLFGKEYTLSDQTSELTSTKVTLYGSAVDQTFNAGETSTVNVGGKQVTINVIGVNTQSATATATIKVNDETATVEKGYTYTIGGERIYVKDIFAYTQPVGGGGVRLFLGSEKIVLEDGQQVAKGVTGTNYVDGTSVSISSSGGKISTITITVTPYNLYPQIKVIKAGEEFVDPVFGAFKWTFTGGSAALDDAGKTKVRIWSSAEDRMSIEFTSKAGIKYSTQFAYGHSTNQISLKIGDYTLHTTGNNVSKNNYFILGSGEYQHIFRLTAFRNSSSAQSIVVQDIGSGTSNEWGFDSNYRGTMVYDGNTYYFVAYPTGTSDGYILLKESDYTTDYNFTNQVYTINDNLITITNTSVTIQEKTGYSGGTPSAYGVLAVPISYTSGASGNDLKISGTPTYTASYGSASWSGAIQVGTTGYNYQALTPFGTFMKYTGGDTPSVEFYVPKEEVTYNVYLAPIAATAVTTGTGTTYKEVQPIKPVVTVLDREVSDYKAQNLIVVGGPCVNSIAATLMPYTTDCWEGFTPGKALIKLFEHPNGNVALLVAGYSADDTRRAARVLANYKDYASKLKGTEVVVTGTDLTNINVEAPTTQ